MHYLAYGSNLHPVRLGERVPSARLAGVVEVTGYRLAFGKRGRDGSGKCHIVRSGHADDAVFGAVYKIDAGDRPALDAFEGHGAGYVDAPVAVTLDGARRVCFTYVAQPEYVDDRLRPFHWYRDLVLAGAAYLGFPSWYIDRVARTPSMADPDGERRREHEALLARVRRVESRGSPPTQSGSGT